jgi:hypothetical protein
VSWFSFSWLMMSQGQIYNRSIPIMFNMGM